MPNDAPGGQGSQGEDPPSRVGGSSWVILLPCRDPSSRRLVVVLVPKLRFGNALSRNSVSGHRGETEFRGGALPNGVWERGTREPRLVDLNPSSTTLARIAGRGKVLLHPRLPQRLVAGDGG